jgi:hypothetical protein
MAPTITYEDLKKKTVAELRDMAKGLTHEAVQGYTQMNKEHLLPALCKALGIEHAHHHVEDGFDKLQIKGRMKMLRAERVKALKDARLREAEGASHRVARAQSPHSRPHDLVGGRRHGRAENVLQPALHLVAQPPANGGAGIDRDVGRRERPADDYRQHDPVPLARVAREVGSGLGRQRF